MFLVSMMDAAGYTEWCSVRQAESETLPWQVMVDLHVVWWSAQGRRLHPASVAADDALVRACFPGAHPPVCRVPVGRCCSQPWLNGGKAALGSIFLLVPSSAFLACTGVLHVSGS